MTGYTNPAPHMTDYTKLTPGERVLVSMVVWTAPENQIKERLVSLDGKAIAVLPEEHAHIVASLLVKGLEKAYDPTEMRLVDLQKERDAAQVECSSAHRRVESVLEALAAAEKERDLLKTEHARLDQANEFNIKQLMLANERESTLRKELNETNDQFSLATKAHNAACQRLEDACKERNEAQDELRRQPAYRAERDALTQTLAVTQHECEAYRRYQDAVDRVFQNQVERPAILPHFLRLGDCKIEGIIRLATQFKELNLSFAKVAAERDDLQRRNDNQAAYVLQYMEEARNLRSQLDALKPGSMIEVLGTLSVLQEKVRACIESVEKAAAAKGPTP